MKRLTLLPALIFAAAVMSGPAHAQEAPAHKGYMDAMMKMDKAMPKDSTGNADTDFARMMIPHHQAAVDMSKVLLQHGKDPALRAMAQKVITDQEKEIAELQEWLKTHKK